MANQEYKSKAGRKKKIIQKPLVVSEDGKLCSITVADMSTSSSGMETEPETKEIFNLNDVEIENENEIHAERSDQDKNNEDCKDVKTVKAQPPYEKEDIKEPQKTVPIISTKGGAGPKGRTKKAVDNEQIKPKVKEIFDFLCDRGVYWKNDLPKNKRYSNRDTKLLEKEVKKKVLEVLESYPKEKCVMEAFEEAERKLKALGERQDQDHDEKEIKIDKGGKLGLSN
ncbi:hypothetical protein TWF192_008781 [Orbilia oligospora]|uniref:Uncharacterized protein n=1 Tax=Orbilia oligospora TaxID=2813651 RepID=A0A6G1M2X0_ORBOL|nr:hypothetical protein TWF191_006557 [Orbilia oligospora]KAF3242007.1 hypothetical protein TWF192_008781 [Orbilia oligospora]